MNYRNPLDYSSRNDNVLYNDIPSILVYQPDIYKFAKYLASRACLSWVIDIGSGSGDKLKKFSEKFSILAIDSEFGIETAKKLVPSATFIQYDLELGLPEISNEIIKNSIVICSDVIEHIRKPELLMEQLAKISEVAPYVLISTPDRDRARGWLDMGPPANPAHVREWSASEFVRFMSDSGFKCIPFYGHTINTNLHRVKSTILTLSGTHTQIKKNYKNSLTIAAIIHGFNEADILSEVVIHLNTQGVQVHYFDNWSTDGSWEMMCSFKEKGLIVNCQRYPDNPTDQYEWHNQLKETAEYAAKLDVDWVMHHDADEIRTSPWPEYSLRDAISYIDDLGFNAIDFTVIDFRYAKNALSIDGHYENKLTHFEFGRRPGHFLQIKCWKNQQRASLHETGGHEACFLGRKVFPIKFLLKHYPLRNKFQAERKIFRDRLPRFNKEKKIFGWHTQYDNFDKNLILGWDVYKLIPWHPTYFFNEYLVERLSGIGLLDE